MSSFEVSVIRSINQTNDEMILLAQLKIGLCREQGLKKLDITPKELRDRSKI